MTTSEVLSLINKFTKSSHFHWCGIKEYLLTNGGGTPGSGVGKGGGGGGSVRESGGSLGEYGAVQEESYFHRMQQHQLENLRKKKKKKDKKDESEEKKDD